MPGRRDIEGIDHREALALLDTWPSAVIVWDLTGSVLASNARAAALFGYERAEMRSLRQLQLLRGDERDRARDHQIERWEDASGCVRRRAVTKTGTPLELEVSTSPYLVGGRPVGIIDDCRDVSAEVRAQRELEVSQRHYRMLFDNAPDCIFLTNLEGRVTSANQTLLDFLGYDLDTVCALEPLGVVAPEDQARVRARWYGASMVPSPEPLEVEVITSSGDRRRLDIRFRLTVDPDTQQPSGVLAVAREVAPDVVAAPDATRAATVEAI